MSIMNRRNAVIGWATWTVFKQVLRRKANAAVGQVEEKAKAPLRLKEKVVEARGEPRKKRGKRRVIGFLVAGAIGVGAWFSARGKGKADLE